MMISSYAFIAENMQPKWISLLRSLIICLKDLKRINAINNNCGYFYQFLSDRQCHSSSIMWPVYRYQIIFPIQMEFGVLLDFLLLYRNVATNKSKANQQKNTYNSFELGIQFFYCSNSNSQIIKYRLWVYVCWDYFFFARPQLIDEVKHYNNKCVKLAIESSYTYIDHFNSVTGGPFLYFQLDRVVSFIIIFKHFKVEFELNVGTYSLDKWISLSK